MTHLTKMDCLYFLTALFFLFNGKNMIAQSIKWEQPILAGYNCYSVALDSNNYIYSICETQSDYPSTAFFGAFPVPRTLPSGKNIFVTKTDTSNNLSWIKVLETSWSFYDPIIKISPTKNVIIATVAAGNLKVDSINMSLPLETETSFIITQLDSAGHVKWLNQIKGKLNSILIPNIDFDSENNIYLSGNVSGTLTFGDQITQEEFLPSLTISPIDNGTSSFIAKYSQEGKFLSAQMIPIVNSQGGSFMYLNSMIIDNDDNIYVTGWFVGKIQYDNTDIESDGIEIIILKFDRNRKLIWSKHLGPGSQTTIQQGTSLAFDKSKKNFYITGNFIGKQDFGNGLVNSDDKNIFLAKYTTDGKLKWLRTSGCWSGAASYTEKGMEVYVDEDDFVYLGGEFTGRLYIGDTTLNVYINPNTSNAYTDFFISKYFANGDFSWAANAGCEYYDFLGSIVKDKYNHVFVGGSTFQGSHFGEYTILAPPDYLNQRGFLACFNDRPETNKFETSHGIEDLNSVPNKIKISPNPFFNNFEIEIQNTECSNTLIQLFDLNGALIFTTNEKSGNTIQKFSYQLNDRPSGIYCLKIAIGNNVYTIKLVKL